VSPFIDNLSENDYTTGTDFERAVGFVVAFEPPTVDYWSFVQGRDDWRLGSAGVDQDV
jgi:hypothetical protein